MRRRLRLRDQIEAEEVTGRASWSVDWLTREVTELKGRPETGKLASDMVFRVTGDGHQGISLSGVGHSAIGSRLQAPVADGREADT